MRDVEGQPIVAVDIAHIRGARPGSARFDPSMTDEERAGFSNLILLCTAHHKLVDRIEPERYPTDLLERWKEDNEPADGLEELLRDDAVNESNLEALITRAVEKAGAVRRIEVDVGVAVVLHPTEFFTYPFEGFGALVEANPHVGAQPHLVCVNIRNSGGMAAVIQGVDLYFEYRLSESDTAASTLMGRNDLPDTNPPLPYRLQDGAAVQWLTKRETIAMLASGATEVELQPAAMYAVVRLASGESVESARVAWANVVEAGFATS